MEIRFWGVRGSVAVSGQNVAWYGGNTPCVEVTHDGHRLILDAGTGIRALGEQIVRQKPSRTTILFSHLHWDHVQGFPFFTPAYVPGNELLLVGPGANGEQALHAALDGQMQPPGFPVTLAAMRAKLTFASALADHPLESGPFTITPIELPHPNGCLGYRIESGGKSFVYATDVELEAQTMSPKLARHLEGADALCLDAMYTPDEYNGARCVSKKGWGHSTMIDAARIAKTVNVGKLLLFHHDPSHDDAFVSTMAEQARQEFVHSEPAREGAQLLLLPRR